MAVKKTSTVTINAPEFEVVEFKIVGDTPLIVHAWDEKAKRMMLEAQMGVKKLKKHDAKNPVEDFIESMYWMSNHPTEMTEEGFEAAVANGATWGFPVTAIKQAANSAAYRNGLVKNQMALRGAYFIDGVGANQLAEIKGCVPVMREDMVKVGMGTADIRHRGEFTNWHKDLTIRYNKNGNFVKKFRRAFYDINMSVCNGIKTSGTNSFFHFRQSSPRLYISTFVLP